MKNAERAGRPAAVKTARKSKRQLEAEQKKRRWHTGSEKIKRLQCLPIYLWTGRVIVCRAAISGL